MRHPDGFQILVAIDQLINTLFYGMPDEMGMRLKAFGVAKHGGM